ncbi:MAG: hybrid sensor histidine kinase/response regulator [Rhizobacter sp.]|nr:hybrid sensor histidine kinase/response regulator [Rhizobacter sp.]
MAGAAASAIWSMVAAACGQNNRRHAATPTHAMPAAQRLLLRLVRGASVVGLLAGLRALAAGPGELAEARFTPLSDTTAPAVASVVTLPDTWAQRGLPSRGAGRYQLSFTLESVPAEPWAIAFDRISSSRRVLLNGQLLETESPLSREHPVPAVLDLPARVLRPGVNELVIDVRHHSRAGLSAATLGPAAELALARDRAALWTRELPRSLNMGMALLAGFMLMIRVRRPSEQAMGYFGLLALLGSVRNYSYFGEITLLPPLLTDWLFFSIQVWSVLLLAAFAASLLPGGLPRRAGRWLCGVALALAGVGAVLAPLRLLPVLRTWSYPLLIALALAALYGVWRAVRMRRDGAHYTLAASLSLVVAAGAHDYLYLEGTLPVTDTFWIPFVMPFALGTYALLLLGRMVGAMSEVERLNLELEGRVQQRTRALQGAIASKTRFIASASHDLRQPVAAIGLMVGLLREQIAVPRLQAMVDRVDEAVASMETMLKGLLDLSRLDSGTVQPRRQRVALQDLFDAIQVHEGEAAMLKALRLRFRPTRLAVESDPVLLEQIVRNLVSNAVRYTERGGVLVAARRRGQGGVLLQVWDSGIGIPPEHHASVFDEFVQVGNTARQRTRGFGLGLSIVRRSADLLGHPLALRSQPGRGSCFGLTLPRAFDERRARTRDQGPAQPLRGLRIVLVEDDAGVRAGLAERLRSWGALVQAHDGVPALRAALPPVGSLKDGRYADLLITDHRLPGGSGLLVIELVRQRCGATRAMVVTGDTSPGDLTLLEASGLPVLHKPFRAEALLDAVQRALKASAIGELPP